MSEVQLQEIDSEDAEEYCRDDFQDELFGLGSYFTPSERRCITKQHLVELRELTTCDLDRPRELTERIDDLDLVLVEFEPFESLALFQILCRASQATCRLAAEAWKQRCGCGWCVRIAGVEQGSAYECGP